MGQVLEALLRVQSIERDLAHVRGRLRARQNAVAAQQKKIDQLREEWQAKHSEALERRRRADEQEGVLKQHEEEVAKYRNALNTAKTNKEYASILTQINTLKADNAKDEEAALQVIQEVEDLNAQADTIRMQIENEEKRLAETQEANADDVAKLNSMLDDLTAKRNEAAQGVPDDVMQIFDRIAERYDGDAMANIEQHGKRPPFEYICGGCFMTLNAEHANALRTKDEVRTCDNCGRILYLEHQESNA